MNIIEIIYKSSTDAFINVGAFVAITLFIFGFINYKFDGKLISSLEKNKKSQVLAGSFLGLTPGCGGAIMVMPLYLLGKVSFGTVVATLIATMGDASFVLMTQSPKMFIAISLISFAVAIVAGYTIDYFGIGKGLLGKKKTKAQLEEAHALFRDEPTEFELNLENASIEFNHIGHEEGDIIDMALHHNVSAPGLLHRFRHTIAYKIFWTFSIIALPLGIMNLMQINIDTDLPIKNLSYIGFIGTFFSLAYTLISKKILADDNHPEVESKINSLKETIIHNAEETAFVITWVFLAMFIYNLFVTLIGGESVMQSFMQGTGFITVLIAVLIGLIPGCGPQIILATLYVQGTIPFSALAANAICNDGDALFPLLAINKKSAVFATLYNLIPALIVGTSLYLAGF